MRKILFFLALFWVTIANSQDYCTTPASSEYPELTFEAYKDLDVSEYNFCVKIYIYMLSEEMMEQVGNRLPILMKH